MSPIRAERERIEEGGPASSNGDHLAHAQRAYLYALHGAAGWLGIHFVVIALIASVMHWFGMYANSSNANVWTPIGFAILMMVFVLSAIHNLRQLLSGDPAYRMSGVLFILKAMSTHWGMYIAVVAWFVLEAIGTPSFLIRAIATAFVVALILLTAWRSRSLLKRCDGGRDALWSDSGAFALIAGVIVILVSSNLGVSTLSNILLSAASIITLLGSLGIALALLKLRSRVGGIMRDMERAEPGPAFEPVGPGS